MNKKPGLNPGEPDHFPTQVSFKLYLLHAPMILTNASNYMKVSLFWKILECLFHVLVDLLTFLPVFWAWAYTFYKRSQQWSFFVTLFLIFKLVLFFNLKFGDFRRFMVYFHIVMGSDDLCFSLILRGGGTGTMIMRNSSRQ